MVYWKSVYEEGATNAEIAAGGTASETFFSSNSAKQQIALKGQSFNKLEINNNSNACVLAVDLDGLSTRRRLINPKNSLVIAPEDNIFFNVVKVTNTSAGTAVAATEVVLNAGMSKAVEVR